MNALAEVSAELNFKNSLLDDATRLRAAAVDVLAEEAGLLDGLSSVLSRSADHRAPGADRDRITAGASRASRHAAAARRRREAMAALLIDTPRPLEGRPDGAAPA